MNTSSGAAIEVVGLTRSFKGRQVLDGVDFEVSAGEIVVVKGRNGAGKTTLIRLLATLLSYDSGRAFVNGFDVVKDPKGVRRSVGLMLANERSMYWRISGRRNLQMFGRLAGLHKDLIANRIDELSHILNVAEFVDLPVSAMSSGQRQRVLLLRAMLRKPPVLLLDEPMRALDDDGVLAVKLALTKEQANGNAALIVDPTAEHLSDIATRTLILSNGLVQQQSAVDVREPQSLKR